MKYVALSLFLLLCSTAAFAGANGAKVYSEYCAHCHGNDGQGKKKAPAVRGKEALKKYKSDAALFKYLKKEMPKDDPGSLSDDELKAVMRWMRGAKK